MNKNLEKKDILKIIGKLAMIILLPLIPNICSDIMSPLATKMIREYIITVWGIPLSIIIAYGYITGDKITSTLSGVLLWPLCGLYSYIFKVELYSSWTLSWGLLYHLFLPGILYGLEGYLASRRGKISLSIAIALGILFIYFLTLIPD